MENINENELGKEVWECQHIASRVIAADHREGLGNGGPSGLNEGGSHELMYQPCLTSDRSMAGPPWTSVSPLCSGSVLHTL